MVLISTTCVGFSSGFTNPFTVGISHQIAGLPMFSGMGYRVLVFIVFYIISSLYLMRYAKKIQRDPEIVLKEAYQEGLLESEEQKIGQNSQAVRLTGRQKLIGIVLILLFAYMIYNVLVNGWGMIEMAGLFVMIAVFSALIDRMPTNDLIQAFMEGCSSVLSGAILIAVANGVSVLMNEAKILDTVVHQFGNLLQGLPVYLSALAIFLFITLFNFFVTSGSGKAIVAMPIISPLARMVGLNQQVAVLAYTLGDGLTNVFYPTSGYFMATIANAKIEWGDWAKFFLPLLGILFLASMALISIAQMIGYGPF
ncbi:YfcC family protein [Aerococcus loyolae]|nr:YfcC family protein [Aerococcus loyolae]